VKPTLLDLAKKLEVRERASKLAVAKVVGVPEGTAKPPESRARWTMNWEQIIHQQDLVELFRHENLRYPGLLLTTSDINGDDLAEKCYHHMRYAVGKLADDPEFKRQLMEVLKSQLIVRRFDMQGLPAAAVFQIIQRNVVEAQKLIFGIAYPPERETRKLKSERIRVVIDDLQVLTKLNPEIIQDGAFFPFLTFFLQREGVTSLLIHTDSLRPSTPAVEATSQALLAILKVAIFTWNVPFEGRSRVAIGVNAYNNAKNGVVRELMVGAKDSPIVTRQFELYTGIEEGKPVPVPLAVYIFNETPQFLAYIDEEDRLFREMFSSVEPSSAVNPGRVIFPVDGPRYMAMRDYTHLALDAQDGHSMIFQVDEFWALQEPHTLQALTEYMAEELPAPDGGSNSGDEERNLKDPFQLFWGEPLTLTEKPAGESGFRRSDFFENSGYKFEPKGEKHYRVPFMWDFGFLLLRNGPWEIARSEKLFAEKIIGMGQSVGYLMSEKAAVAKARKKIEEIIPLADKKTPVSAVQEGIEKGISWRKFLGACSKVAEVYSRQTGVNTTPFDVASPSSETMNTLLLEIWLSEVKVEAEILGYTLAPEDSKSLVHLLTRTHAGCREKLTEDLFREFATEAKAWGRDIDWNTRVKAFRKLPIGALCLYKTWLLLIEAFAFEDFLEPDNPFSLRQGRTAALHSAASRHWYKTACAFASELAHSVGIDDSLVAQRLPGHYSTRGDWYLASPQSSRSQLLAQRALDLLCSRRANLTRMQRGLGLPVRDVLQMGRCEKLRTALRCKQPRKRTGAAAVKRAGGESEQTLTELTYLDLVSFGRGSDLEWLKRSEIKDYDRVSRPLQKWLVRLFRWTGEYKRESDRHWRGGFPGYDDITCKSFEVVQNYKSFEYFGELCDFLVDELNAAVRKRQVDLPNPQGPLKKKAATA
jgi:hypothetical protein